MRCPWCGTSQSHGSWEELARRVFQVQPLTCPSCQQVLLAPLPEAAPGIAEAILHHAESGSIGPFELRPSPPAAPAPNAASAAA
jgi:hypothetical protein